MLLRTALAITLAGLLSACVTVPATNDPAPSEVPAYERCDAAGTADSRAICVSFRAFDVALTAVDGLRDVGVIVPGTPRALAVQAAIRETQTALNDASAIQRGLRSGDLASTLIRAAAALNRLRAAIS